VNCRLERAGGDTEMFGANLETGRPEAQISAAAEAVLPFRIQLNQAALLTAMEGDANFAASEQYIPGSVIQGVIAALFVGDSDFHRLICSGEVRFLPAYPEIVDSGAPRRSFPVPHAVRALKSDDKRLFNLAATESDEPLRRVSGWCLPDRLHETGYSPLAEVRKDFAYHHARAEDERIGRAVGEEYRAWGLTAAQAGAFFAYEALSPGQLFHGAILGRGTDVDRIRQALPSGSAVVIGRSRTAQYGGSARWNWGDPVAAQSSAGEQSGWQPQSPPLESADAEAPSEDVVAMLLSPLIGQNENGLAGPYFPYGEIEQALGVAIDRNSSQAFARTMWSGRYLSHQALPRSQFLALRPGSVFRLRLSNPVPLTRAQIDEAARASYGMRTEEGFGRIAFWLKVEAEPRLKYAEAEIPPEMTVLREGHPARGLALEILKSRIEERTRREGNVWASEYKSGQLTNHLIARILKLVENRSSADARRALSQIREVPKDKLSRVWVRAGNRKTPLFEFLRGSLESDPPSVAEASVMPWPVIFPGTSPLAGPEQAVWREKLQRLYLSSGLRAMAWKNRPAPPTSVEEVS
jgi:hypothetical protein